ncbi:MAG: hypothetical protein JJT78_02020, partial [Leptospira sp.]|nr:hypothetical protein [Leptospira sp.]
RKIEGSSRKLGGNFDFEYLFLLTEILLIALVLSVNGTYLGGILSISYFLLPGILLRYLAKCLPFNLFYRNILIGFFSIALLFEFPEQRFHWMDYYSVTLLTVVALVTYSVMNYILHQYNRDTNMNMQTKG